MYYVIKSDTRVGLQALKFATFLWANVLEINVVIVVIENWIAERLKSEPIVENRISNCVLLSPC